LNIIHYNSAETKFRSLKRVDNYLDAAFNNESEILYNQCKDINDFIQTLNSRLTSPDIVIITSHGSDDSLLSLRRGRMIRVMRKSQTRFFKHNFIVAIACQTANEFGPEAIRESAQTYVGFNDFIQCDFEFDSSKNGKLNSILEVIFKKVYQDSFNHSLEKFIKQCWTSNEFVQNWEIDFKRKVRQTGKMNLEEIRTEYSVPVTEKYEEQIKTLIKLEFISKYNTLNEKLVLLGDPNYIPWYYIYNLDEMELKRILGKVENILDENNYYKYFLKSLIHKFLNNVQDFEKSVIDMEACLADSELLFEPPVDLKKLAN
jgi:hypothetical protein